MALLLLVSLRVPAAERPPILPPDAAARAYEAGRDLVRSGKYTEGVKRLQEALATGHRRAAESFGTSRYPVDRYDPDYWLGVAYMELGDDARAREHLGRSKANKLIERWPEALDLNARLETLERRARPTLAPPTPTAPPPAPTATAPPALPAPPTPALILAPAIATVPSPSPAAATTPAARQAPTALVRELVAAISTADWTTAESALGNARVAAPDAHELELLEAVMSGSRYLLEGSRDGALLARARRSLAAYRQHGGSRRAEQVWLSPVLSALLTGR